MRTSNAILKVMESCLDDRRTLLQESKAVDPEKGAVLTRLADERWQFAEKLAELTPPRTTGTWRESVRELGSRIWARAAGANVGDAIAVCKRSQHRTRVRYEKALELDWPSEVRAILSHQYDRVRAADYELSKIEFSP